MKAIHSAKRGFTLIEILIVIGIIAILAAIVIIAINPAKQFAQARNTQRQAAVNTILNAIGQRIADNKGTFGGSFTIGTNTYTCPTLPPSTPSTPIDNGAGTGLDFSCLQPTYVASLPVDPDATYATGVYTGYDVGTDATGRVTVCANQAATETSIPGAAAICVTR
ncbi:MAG TPA: prepilin-type N-terminal cleavage/methylation domain-containing protein [Candidatus Paceibacterota bacterium]|nr:prepilin-type N-terminal cleavage/methylation domain-containing protein [Candidatus Paceibacterota bacterium]